MLLEDAQLLLSVWRERLVSDDTVVAWADAAIAGLAASELPGWLLDLSLQGPSRCMAGSSADFIDVPDLAFITELAIRASLLDLTNNIDVAKFIEWVARASLGESHSAPEVEFGYRTDDFWNDGAGIDAAMQFVRDELPKLLPSLPVLPALIRATIFVATTRASPSDS